MRTAYQAKQFEFIQVDVKKRNVKTIEEMHLQNYSLAIHKETKTVHYEQMDFYKKFRIEEFDLKKTTNKSFIRQILSDGTKRGYIIHSDALHALHDFTKSKMSFNVLPQAVMTNHIGFFLSTNDFIFGSFNGKLVQLLESGICQKITENYNAPLANIDRACGPIIFTFNHLIIGFELWLFFLALSCACFLIELLGNILLKAKK